MTTLQETRYFFEVPSQSIRRVIYHFELSVCAMAYARDACTFRPLTDAEKAIYRADRTVPPSDALTDEEKEALRMWRARKAEDDFPPEEAAALRERARDEYAYGSDNNIEVDDDAGFSVSDEGIWVQAWVWLHGAGQSEEQAA